MTLDEAMEELRAALFVVFDVLAAYDAERAEAKQCEPWCRAGWDDGNLCGPGCVNPKVKPTLTVSPELIAACEGDNPKVDAVTLREQARAIAPPRLDGCTCAGCTHIQTKVIDGMRAALERMVAMKQVWIHASDVIELIAELDGAQ